MMPEILGVPSYLVSYMLAAAFGIAVGARLGRAAGFPTGRTALAVAVLAASILIGAKALYLVERAVAPLAGPYAARPLTPADLLWTGVRFPGGIVFLNIMLPVICWVLSLPTRRFADAVIPAIGVAIALVRLGCFANGCCFGSPSSLPWAIAYPVATVAYDWQIYQRVIVWPAVQTHAVHPLQLYFALAGVGIYLAGRYWQHRARFDRQVLLDVSLLYFASTFLLEFLGGYWLVPNIALCGVMAVVLAALRVAARSGRAGLALSMRPA